MGAGADTASRLREAREAAGLSQAAAAKAIGATKVSVSRWENGRAIGAAHLAKLARAYGVPVGHLLGEVGHQADTSQSARKTSPRSHGGDVGTEDELAGDEALPGYWSGYQAALLGVMEDVAAMQARAIRMQRKIHRFTTPQIRGDVLGVESGVGAATDVEPGVAAATAKEAAAKRPRRRG